MKRRRFFTWKRTRQSRAFRFRRLSTQYLYSVFLPWRFALDTARHLPVSAAAARCFQERAFPKLGTRGQLDLFLAVLKGKEVSRRVHFETGPDKLMPA